MSQYYQINHGPVVFERHADEIIAIHLDSGAYFSMGGAAARLWELLDTGMAVDSLEKYFTAAHEGEPAAIAAAVRAFVERLAAAQLIVPAAGGGVFPVPPAEKSPFPAFDLQVYTDMQDLLLLDPVHDVGDGGWPLTSR